jgi:hypothetical protein
MKGGSMDEPYKRPTREEIEARIAARDAAASRQREADRRAMFGEGWDPLGRQELAELDGLDETGTDVTGGSVARCRTCGCLVTAVGHHVACGER